jgi:predicted nucleic acid-binding protein
MTGLILVDTNVLLYTVDPKEPVKAQACAAWLRALAAAGSMTISPQVAGEVRSAGVRKLKLDPRDADTLVRNLLAWCTAPLGAAEVARALELAARWRMSWWDAQILASAVGGGCTGLLTEDRQSAPVIEGVRYLDPFALAPQDVLG